MLNIRSITVGIAACGLALALSGANADAASLTVEISGVRGDAGRVRVALYNKAKGFPSKGRPIKGADAKAQKGKISVKFDGLAPGKYAIAVYHDENGNKKLDTNLMGIPSEGFGFSKDAVGSFGAPSFKAAAIAVGQANKTISINLGY